MKIKALPVSVYRTGKMDCTNGGVSSRFNELLVACPDGHITIDTEVGIPDNFCMAQNRELFNIYGCDTMKQVRIVPATVDDSGNVVPRSGWWMYGGNIADASDSRLRDMTGVFYPLHIHDRQE